MKVPILILCLLGIAIPAFSEEFTWVDTEGKYRDLFAGDRAVVRYVYEPIDESSPERRDETYKPFHHVFHWWSKERFITKGPGGKFTHHRGIYYGFSKCSYVDEEGKTHENIDTWHCRKAYQVHREFLTERTVDDSAELTTRIDWVDNEGKPFASEERTLTFRYEEGQSSDLVIGFRSKLTPLVPKVKVDGDPQHAGFQFRAHNDVNENTAKQTYYIRPVSGQADPGKTINWSKENDTEATRDLPWKVMSFELFDSRYSVLYVDSDTNPKPARYSERDYGRFGSYFVAEATPEKPLEVEYHLVIRKGEFDAEEAAKLAELVKID